MKLSSSIEKKWLWLGLLGVCVLVSFLLYARLLHSYFFGEDLRHLTFGWSELRDEFFGSGRSVGFRPGSTFYLVLSNVLWGRNPLAHHATMVLLHALAGWLVGLILYRMTKNPLLGAMAALIFLCAPVQMEPVVWLAAGAGSVTSTLLCLLAMWIWTGPNADRKVWAVSGAAFLYLLAILTKELALPLPGMLMVLDWALKRKFNERSIKSIFLSLLSYWPFVLALGIYAFLYWHSGALSGASNYEMPQGVNLLYTLAHASYSAHDLMLPLSDVIDLGAGPASLLWILAIGVLVVLSRMRWTFAMMLVGLLPSFFVTGGRMSYLGMAGFSMGVAALTFELARWVSKRVPALKFQPVVIGLLAILLISDALDIFHMSPIYLDAGAFTWSVPRQAQALVPELPPNAEMYFIGFPENAGYRWSIPYEVQFVYGDPNLLVYSVVDGPAVWDKISLQSIPCDDSIPRYFFKYSEEDKSLSLVSASEFGLNCP